MKDLTANGPCLPRPQVSAKIGGKAPAGLGQDALLDFQMEGTLDGERLTAAEIRELLEKSATTSPESRGPKRK